jgi:hypothetical protein
VSPAAPARSPDPENVRTRPGNIRVAKREHLIDFLDLARDHDFLFPEDGTAATESTLPVSVASVAGL